MFDGPAVKIVICVSKTGAALARQPDSTQKGSRMLPLQHNYTHNVDYMSSIAIGYLIQQHWQAFEMIKSFQPPPLALHSSRYQILEQ